MAVPTRAGEVLSSTNQHWRFGFICPSGLYTVVFALRRAPRIRAAMVDTDNSARSICQTICRRGNSRSRVRALTDLRRSRMSRAARPRPRCDACDRAARRPPRRRPRDRARSSRDRTGSRCTESEKYSPRNAAGVLRKISSSAGIATAQVKAISAGVGEREHLESEAEIRNRRARDERARARPQPLAGGDLRARSARRAPSRSRARRCSSRWRSARLAIANRGIERSATDSA